MVDLRREFPSPSFEVHLPPPPLRLLWAGGIGVLGLLTGLWTGDTLVIALFLALALLSGLSSNWSM